MGKPSLWVSGEGNTEREQTRRKVPRRSPGEAGAARCEGSALNTGDLDRRGQQPRPGVQGRKLRPPGRRGVGRVRSTGEGGETHWREGALPDEANRARKERGLWRH